MLAWGSLFMYCDYHTPTPLCLHASGTPQEYVQSAVRAGLREYGISDHAPMQEEPFDDWRMKQADMGAYLDWIREATELAAPHGLTVKAGLECDWFPGIEPWTDHLRGLYEWDYLIGSVHYLGEKEEFDNPYKMDFWNTTDVEDAWEQYWKRFRDMAASGLFHILGHADLIKKFGFRPGGDLRRYYEPALEAISRSGACLEINTAGWYNKCAEQYPDELFLRLAAEMDIPLTISSDAHAPENVGRDFDRAAELASRAGFRQLASFTAGKMRLFPLTGI